MPLIIGVAGAIATGKSSACRLLMDRGATYCHVDKLVHRLYEPGTAAYDRIVAMFGRGIVGIDGYLDRHALGAKVFGKSEEMQKLINAIGSIRAAVKELVGAWQTTLAPADVALLEAVNLIEAGYGAWCHQVWLFACHEDTARQRLIERHDFTFAEANQRLASQRPWEKRAPAADLLIFNNDDYEDFARRVRAEFLHVYDLWNRGALPPSQYHAWWRARHNTS